MYELIFRATQRQKTEDEAESEDDAIEDRFTKVKGGGAAGRHSRRGRGASDSVEDSSSSDDDFSEGGGEGDQPVSCLFLS